MTMEVSSQKRPSGTALPGFYSQHTKSIEDFMLYPVASATTKADKANVTEI
jgi:hypothetical protein